MKKKSSFKDLKDSLFLGLSGKENASDRGGLGEARNWAKDQFLSWTKWGANPIVMKMGN